MPVLFILATEPRYGIGCTFLITNALLETAGGLSKGIFITIIKTGNTKSVL